MQCDSRSSGQGSTMDYNHFQLPVSVDYWNYSYGSEFGSGLLIIQAILKHLTNEMVFKVWEKHH